MLDYILRNTLYRVKTKNDEVHVGTIDDVSEYFGDGVKIFERLATPHQFKELKDFFSKLEKYEAEHGYTYIEDFYNNVYAKE